MTRGKWIILVIFGIALAASISALYYLRGQAHRSIEFWGAENAQRIVQSPRVELIVVEAEVNTQEGRGSELPHEMSFAGSLSKDISQARGLYNIRRGLLTDANFDWAANPPRQPPRWDYALRFSDETSHRTTLLLSLADQRIALSGSHRSLSTSPVAKGLRAFIEEHSARAPE